MPWAAEHAQPEDEEGHVGHAEILVFEQAQVDERVFDREFDDEEDGQPDRGQGEAGQNERRRPAAGVPGGRAVGQGQQEKRQEQGDRKKADEVERTDPFRSVFPLDEHRGRDPDQADGDVDVEDRVPGEVVDQIASDHRSERDGRRGGDGPEPQGQAALLDGKFPGDDGHPDRHQEPRPGPLDDAEKDQAVEIPGQGAEEGPGGEQGQRQE
ncbi:MAG: hypothetical protein ABSA30_15100, partial [Candidatus Aminicenantales bacterium]